MKVHRYPITDTLFRFGITLSIFLSGYIVTAPTWRPTWLLMHFLNIANGKTD